MLAPVASIARRAASVTSGPMPSPGIRVTRIIAPEGYRANPGLGRSAATLYPEAMPEAMGEKGLREIIAAETSISDIDGDAGRLWYAGYEIGDLARNATFEETVYLLHNLALPNRQELNQLHTFLVRERELHPFLAKDDAHAGPERLGDVDASHGHLGIERVRPRRLGRLARGRIPQGHPLIAETPTLIATFDRLRTGREVIPPHPDLSHAANFLWMLHGEEPDPADARVLDTTFVLYADHTMNASTFTARVIASTLSDMFSAITGAIGALKGPLHGGANEESQKMAEEVGKPENAEAYVRDRLARHDKVMGFGHAVYRTMDPRAAVLKQLCQELGERVDETQWYEIFAALEARRSNRKVSTRTSTCTRPASTTCSGSRPT